MIVSLLLSGLPLPAQQGPAGFDFFGTTQVTLEQLKEALGSDVDRLVEYYRKGELEAFANVREKIGQKLATLGDFAFAEVSLIRYFGEGEPIYVTLDFVDETERETRMNFLPEPGEELEDPAGLLAAWRKYEESSMRLFRNGALAYGEDCPALHCTVGFGHPELKAFRDLFEEQVPKHSGELLRVLREDRRSLHRADAAFLLAHADSPEWIIQSLQGSIRDSSSEVRNNVLRVLAMASRRPEFEIPLEPLLDALHFPTTTDRNKVLAALDGLADRPELQPKILKDAGQLLIRLLRLQQPNNHDFAYSILKKLSGQDFGGGDFKAWEKWFEEVSPET